jgi:putative SOS response-associated peptidase YedK
MCGRFSQAYTWAEILAFSQPLTDGGTPRNLQARYNIAPTTEIDIIRRTAAGGRELIKARWGLVPGWWKKPLKDMPATFNARAETVDEKAMFRHAFVTRRCIIPATGFFEWTGEKKERIPHHISAADGAILGFAGLWETWRSPEGEEIVTATIIVREANAFMAKIHDRMPAMLHPRDFDAWLSGAGGKELLMQPPPELREWIVDARVNKAGVGNDDPATIEPVT